LNKHDRSSSRERVGERGASSSVALREQSGIKVPIGVKRSNP